ncbi:MAG: hypothetical protein Q8O66_01355 [bacterium]|nr:hypothetical protein [bacterium]
MKFFNFLKIFLPILIILWLIYIGVFLFIDNRERSFNEKLKANLEKMISDKNKEKTEQEAKNKVFDPEVLKWNLVSPEAPFSKRDAHTLNIFKNKLWIFGGVGGTSPDYSKNNSDVWNSENGKDWIQITNKVPWGPRRAHDSLVFKDKIWILGGVTTGERYLNDVWSSEDGVNWVQVTEKAEWAPRKGFGAVVFDNKMWVMGGVSINGLENDVWYSENGKDWFLAINHAEWSPRYDLAVESFKDKIWLVGGVFPEEMGKKDVWVSENGKNWTSINEKNIWPGRHGHCLLVFNDNLFIIGGWSGYAHGYNDAWYSKDGVVWNELYKDGSSLWVGREDLACVGFNNKIFMTGGMKTSGERTNDVWYLGEK